MDRLRNFIAGRRRYLIAKIKIAAKISAVITTLTSVR